MLTGEPKPSSTEDRATILGRRQRSAATEPTAAPSVEATDGEIQFGPGVHVVGNEPRALASGVIVRRRRSVVAYIASLVVVACVAAVLWWWLHDRGSLTISSVHARAATPVIGCDSVADLQATVKTNGRAGMITYHWIRSDGTVSGAETERLSAGHHEAILTMRWHVEGPGVYNGRAVLDVDSPTIAQATATFSYHCP